jgi:hypothetical protein
MKALLLLCFALLLPSCALAGPCAPLEYQEMKDMTVNDLIKEACRANSAAADDFDLATKYQSTSAAAREASRDNEQCSGQVDRMLRIIASKGVSEKLYKLCEQQAQGKIIVAANNAKSVEAASQVSK